ncbi:MAG: sulfatase-like hydrolase/transferase, partial [Pirellulaceae bacterium]
DEFYGFLGHGAHDYFELKKDDDHNSIWRNWERIDDTGYLTDNLGREAASFIRRHKEEPFFLYLPFNAVHWPLQAPPEDVAEFDNENPGRNIYLGMLKRMDLSVGVVLDELKKHDLQDNTLLLFYSDNGGSKKVFADNGRLRDYKQSTYEGGVRVPFMVSWPAVLEEGRQVDEAAISLDFFPTICEAAGLPLPEGTSLDGKSLLPLLKGEQQGPFHERLYWDGDEGRIGMRSGDWKLVGRGDQYQLFDLSGDPGEQKDLAGMFPEKLAELKAEFTTWRKTLPRTLRQQKSGLPRAAPAPSSSRGSSKRPNVLLVICDDLNRHVSTSGYKHIQTPALDRLAATGMTFGRAYCQYPVCGPSRASFLTGVYPESTGILDNKSDIRVVRPELKSLPQLFKEGGYWTGGVGKVFHGNLDHGEVAWNEYHSFQNEWNPVLKPIQDAFEKKHGSIDLPENQKPWRAVYKEFRRTAGGQSPPGFGPTTMTDAQHRDGKNVRQVARWIDDEAHGDKPFFITCGIHKPHVPFWAPQKYFDQYPQEKLVVDAVPADDWADIPPLALNHRYKAFGFEAAVENMDHRREYMQAYHACISFVDAQIGLLWEALDRNKLWDNTVVVFMSDHGYHLGEHFQWGKVTLFEECARVPFMVHAPGLTTAGSRSESLVELVDLLPTLCEIAGISIPETVQ